MLIIRNIYILTMVVLIEMFGYKELLYKINVKKIRSTFWAGLSLEMKTRVKEK